jgi:hypothetical protein
VALDSADNAGYIRISPLDASGYTEEGYDINGFDRSGLDKNGYNRSDRDKDGYDRSGWDKDGYDRNRQRYDRNGYDSSGLDKNGYDKNGIKCGIGTAGPSGGYIFYDKGTFSDGWRFLEAAPSNAEFTASWDDAMRRCQDMTINGFGGWRLPTKDELNRMYIILKPKGLMRDGDIYWSSSEYDNNSAWLQAFKKGTQLDANKFATIVGVRAVRAF